MVVEPLSQSVSWRQCNIIVNGVFHESGFVFLRSVWPWNNRIDADGFGVDGGGVVNGIL